MQQAYKAFNKKNGLQKSKKINMKKQILSIILGFITMMFVSTAYAGTVFALKSEKGYTVRSVVDEHEITTAYSKKGKLVYAITRYTSDNLDKNIIEKIKTAYNNYTVTGIEKVEQPGFDVVYVVHLENETSLKTVRISNDEIELVQDFVKG